MRKSAPKSENQLRSLFYRPWRTFVVLLAFLVNACTAPLVVQAQDYYLPVPGMMIYLSPAFVPPLLKGIKVHPEDPFKFEFILDVGDASNPSIKRQVSNLYLRQESVKLIKYFLASLTIPENDLWVNLSPYEKDRIVPKSFGQTTMGRDLLAEDYMLKQITASLIYPQGQTGKKFWAKIYAEAARRFGTTDIPVKTFNKVWILPDKAIVFENSRVGTAYVVTSKLKVMLEEDYLSLQKHEGIKIYDGRDGINGVTTNKLGSQIVREIVIPALTKEVNEGKNFAHLRQVYNSLILATWYKKKIKESILERVYEDKNKIAGVNIDDPQEKQRIYERYLRAFKKGVFNYIKEDIDLTTQQKIPRKYFSGGLDMAMTTSHYGLGQEAFSTTSNPQEILKSAELAPNQALVVTANIVTNDKAMAGRLIGGRYNLRKWLIPLISGMFLTFNTSQAQSDVIIQVIDKETAAKSIIQGPLDMVVKDTKNVDNGPSMETFDTRAEAALSALEKLKEDPGLESTFRSMVLQVARSGNRKIIEKWMKEFKIQSKENALINKLYLEFKNLLSAQLKVDLGLGKYYALTMLQFAGISDLLSPQDMRHVHVNELKPELEKSSGIALETLKFLMGGKVSAKGPYKASNDYWVNHAGAEMIDDDIYANSSFPQVGAILDRNANLETDLRGIDVDKITDSAKKGNRTSVEILLELSQILPEVNASLEDVIKSEAEKNIQSLELSDFLDMLIKRSFLQPSFYARLINMDGLDPHYYYLLGAKLYGYMNDGFTGVVIKGKEVKDGEQAVGNATTVFYDAYRQRMMKIADGLSHSDVIKKMVNDAFDSLRDNKKFMAASNDIAKKYNESPRDFRYFATMPHVLWPILKARENMKLELKYDVDLNFLIAALFTEGYSLFATHFIYNYDFFFMYFDNVAPLGEDRLGTELEYLHSKGFMRASIQPVPTGLKYKNENGETFPRVLFPLLAERDALKNLDVLTDLLEADVIGNNNNGQLEWKHPPFYLLSKFAGRYNQKILGQLVEEYRKSWLEAVAANIEAFVAEMREGVDIVKKRAKIKEELPLDIGYFYNGSGEISLQKLPQALGDNPQEGDKLFISILWRLRATASFVHAVFPDIIKVNFTQQVKNPSPDMAMNIRKGGIDLTSASIEQQTQNAGQEIKFHMNEAQLASLQNALGFVPEIIDIRRLKSLPGFLGLDKNYSFSNHR